MIASAPIKLRNFMANLRRSGAAPVLNEPEGPRGRDHAATVKGWNFQHKRTPPGCVEFPAGANLPERHLPEIPKPPHPLRCAPADAIAAWLQPCKSSKRGRQQ